ncbi:MAG: hypothetical protein LJE84_10730 [Gammaproteobacteria bacterium]|nr:hypothetical protein [Gammaproteobacteria bacterium]
MKNLTLATLFLLLTAPVVHAGGEATSDALGAQIRHQGAAALQQLNLRIRSGARVPMRTVFEIRSDELTKLASVKKTMRSVN